MATAAVCKSHKGSLEVFYGQKAATKIPLIEESVASPRAAAAAVEEKLSIAQMKAKGFSPYQCIQKGFTKKECEQSGARKCRDCDAMGSYEDSRKAGILYDELLKFAQVGFEFSQSFAELSKEEMEEANAFDIEEIFAKAFGDEVEVVQNIFFGDETSLGEGLKFIIQAALEDDDDDDNIARKALCLLTAMDGIEPKIKNLKLPQLERLIEEEQIKFKEQMEEAVQSLVSEGKDEGEAQEELAFNIGKQMFVAFFGVAGGLIERAKDMDKNCVNCRSCGGDGRITVTIGSQSSTGCGLTWA